MNVTSRCYLQGQRPNCGRWSCYLHARRLRGIHIFRPWARARTRISLTGTWRALVPLVEKQGTKNSFYGPTHYICQFRGLGTWNLVLEILPVVIQVNRTQNYRSESLLLSCAVGTDPTPRSTVRAAYARNAAAPTSSCDSV